MEPRPVLAVSLNSAWQKTLSFSALQTGAVNRAVECHEAGGGKGVNVARVFRLLQLPVALAAFVGGHTGECLRKELRDTGVEDLTVTSQGVTRCCYTVIDREKGEATELIEPSALVSTEEYEALKTLLAAKLPRYGAMALCGSLPPGVPADTYAQLTALAREAGVPVILDAVKNVAPTLEIGVRLLKINAEELSQMSPAKTPTESARQLLERFPRLEWLAVTDGGHPARLFGHGRSWTLTLPRLEKIVSPIGGGDCATAIMTRRLAEGCTDGLAVAQAFAEALACASASCLTDTPSVFEPGVAMRLLAQTVINEGQQ